MEPSLEHSSRRDGVAPDASPPTPLEQDPAVQPASDAVRYVEPGEDDNEEEQLFIETIRRGALAVQQRRRRLLEGPARSRSTSLQAAGVNESSNNADDYPAFRSSSAIVDSVAAGRLSSTSSGSESASTRLHSLISSSRLGAHLDTLRTSSGQIASRGADATGTSTATETEGPMMLLYCDSLPLDPSSPCLLLGLQPTSSSHATRVDITRTLASSYNTTSADARLQHDVPDLITAGGCGKLICARGFQNRKHGRHAFSSDTLPSHLLVDWLDVSLDEEGAFRCRSTCGCLYATLGCRNCGNPVGVSKVYICESARCTSTQELLPLFWTRCAMIRRPGLPLPAVWDKGTAMGDIELPPDLVRTETNAYLPCKGGDHRDGLAGDALEWAQRSESRLNTALLKDAHIDGEGVKAAGQQLGSQGPLPSAGLNAFERVSWAGGWAVDTREDQILERAQALRRDLRTYIGRSMTADNDTHSPAMNEVSRLRRRSYRNLLASPRAEMNDGDEREFRRRRTAEILESGRQQYEQNVQPLVMRSSSFDGPVGR